MKPFLLSIPEARKTLGGECDPIGRTTIYRLIESQRLEAVKVGKRTFITYASIEALVASAPRLADVRTEQIIQLHREGLSQRDIASELGCGLGTVNRTIKHHKEAE